MSANARVVKVSASGVPATLVAWASSFATTSSRFSRSCRVTFASPELCGCLDRMVRAGLADYPAHGMLADTDLAGDVGIRPVFDVVEPKDRLHGGPVASSGGMVGADLPGHLAPEVIGRRLRGWLDRGSVPMRIAAHIRVADRSRCGVRPGAGQV